MARARRSRAARWVTLPKWRLWAQNRGPDSVAVSPQRRRNERRDHGKPWSRGFSGRYLAFDDTGRLVAEPAIDRSAQDAADQRRDPEQPQLLDCPAADEQRRAADARRVH